MREGLGKDRHRRVRGKNAVAVARKDVRTLVLFVSFRVAAKTICEGAQFARWLRYRCSETSFSSRLTTMAEAARHGRREQPGYFVCNAEFFPDGEESPPSHQGQLRCGRRGLPSCDGSFTRTPLCEKEQTITARVRAIIKTSSLVVLFNTTGAAFCSQKHRAS